MSRNGYDPNQRRFFSDFNRGWAKMRAAERIRKRKNRLLIIAAVVTTLIVIGITIFQYS